MKEARVSPAHAANLMADSDNALYGAQVIDSLSLLYHIKTYAHKSCRRCHTSLYTLMSLGVWVQHLWNSYVKRHGWSNVRKYE